MQGIVTGALRCDSPRDGDQRLQPEERLSSVSRRACLRLLRSLPCGGGLRKDHSVFLIRRFFKCISSFLSVVFY